ncbi:hypothetical protein GJAV_G00027970 [Gymnothorax javanicus]|nr:hypothetical protein GJAV_G00027970 [Gymnothorax javanicus]
MDTFFRAAVCELDKLLDDFEQSKEEPLDGGAEESFVSPTSLDLPGSHFAPTGVVRDILPTTHSALESIGEESGQAARPSQSEAPCSAGRGMEENLHQSDGSLMCVFTAHRVGVPELAEETRGENVNREDLEWDCGVPLDCQGVQLQDNVGVLPLSSLNNPPNSVSDPAVGEKARSTGEHDLCLAEDVHSPVFQVQRTFSVDDAVSHLTCGGPVSDLYRGMARSLSGTLPRVASLSRLIQAPITSVSPKKGVWSPPCTVRPEPLPDVPEDFQTEKEQVNESVVNEKLGTFLEEQVRSEDRRVGLPLEKHAEEGISEMNGDGKQGPAAVLEHEEGLERRELGGSVEHGAHQEHDTEPSLTVIKDEDSNFSSPSLDQSLCEADLTRRDVCEDTSESAPHNRPHVASHCPDMGGQSHADLPVPAVGGDIPTLSVIDSGHPHQMTTENISVCDEDPPSPSHSPSPCTSEISAVPLKGPRRQGSPGPKQPSWVPDCEAPCCMHCLQCFTLTRRRHHCRTCGKVYCDTCCNRKFRLKFLERNARVCIKCYKAIHREGTAARTLLLSGALVDDGQHDEESTMSPRGPSPNRCAPPRQQSRSSSTLSPAPPTIMAPVSVLKHPCNEVFPREQRRVWFADGLLPNGEVADTTRLSAGGKRSSVDPSSVTTEPLVAKGNLGEEPREPPGDQRAEDQPPVSGPWDYSLLCRVAACVERSSSLLPEEEEGLPPLLFITEEEHGGDVLVQECPSPSQILELLEEGGPQPLTFVLNANLLVNVKLVTYCDRKCWCFSSNGLQGVGQLELVFILQRLPEESTVPRDIFILYIRIYQDAQRSRFVQDLGCVLVEGGVLGSREHGGFLFFSPSHQPLEGLSLPASPFLCGVLIHKLEVPWAKVFPLRLLLRLGAEFSVYPTTLLSVRSRKAVYSETGHTILSLLADFRNFQYNLPVVEGLHVHMEMGNSYILIPKAKFTQVLKVVNSSDEHVISMGTSFSWGADSHLVCFQNEDGSYQTQANGMLGKTRTMTGASFVVFNGALKATSGFIARSSIVEDGLMVQITPDSMEGLRQALQEQKDFQIACGKADSTETQEKINVRWVDRPLRITAGLTSPVDGRSLDEALSVHMEHDMEVQADGKTIKCSEVFYLPKTPGRPVLAVPSLLCHLQQDIAKATCAALRPSLSTLKNSGINFLGLRISFDLDMVEYQAGSRGRVLPQRYMNDLDSALIPLIHGGTSSIPPQPTDMELHFYITEAI